MNLPLKAEARNLHGPPAHIPSHHPRFPNNEGNPHPESCVHKLLAFFFV